jgi:adenine-specific DNA-methyltransferase
LNKVKLIYIDPPYNTGKDFIYDDDFSERADDFLRRSNQTDESGRRLVANTQANGRFHSDWLTMMYARLRLALNLLADDGAIFISIDDNEIQNLRCICDEVFGSANFIANVIWHKMDSPKNSARHLSEDHDYILLYAKNAELWRPRLLPRSEKMVDRYQNPDNDPRGPWLLGDLAARNYYSKGTYEAIGAYQRKDSTSLRQTTESGGGSPAATDPVSRNFCQRSRMASCLRLIGHGKMLEAHAMRSKS